MKKKALGLFSGGLDSVLAIKLILKQGIEVVALNFDTPFYRRDAFGQSNIQLEKIAEALGVKLCVISLAEEYLDIVKSPKHGYGKNLNPCIDCRILKFKKAKDFMQKIKASFIVSGEVLGQRPMSQYRQALDTIDREAGTEGLVLRPLSAKLLSPTLAEKEGWVKRKDLFEISGRGRSQQIELANKLGVYEYSPPGGGCLLADSIFSQKVKNLMEFNNLKIKNIEILKAGRYFRLSSYCWLVVARDESESKRLFSLADKDDSIFEPLDLPGPTALARGRVSEELKEKVCYIVAQYTSKQRKIKVRVKTENKEAIVDVDPIEDKEFNTLKNQLYSK